MEEILSTNTNNNDECSNTVIFDDLSGRSFSHLIIDFDLSFEYGLEELRESVDVQSTIDN